MDAFRSELADVDLAEGLAAWEAWVRREYASETIRKYLPQVAVLFPRDAKGKFGVQPLA